jgi:hypothetical protein
MAIQHPFPIFGNFSTVFSFKNEQEATKKELKINKQQT